MSFPSRVGYLVAALGLHAAVLWGVRFGPPAFISSEEDPGESVEVALIESAEEVAASPAEPSPPEPPPPEPPPPPNPPEPPPTQEPPPPPPDAIPDPVPAPEPKPTPKPQPKPRPRVASRPAAAPVAAPATSGAKVGSTTGNPGATAAKPSRGDRSHATWRNRVRPSYPSSARTAGQAGRVLIIVNVNALGQSSGARIYQGSGFANLDQAALAAARSSTYYPKQVLGIPMSDTITIPYTFRLEDR